MQANAQYLRKILTTLVVHVLPPFLLLFLVYRPSSGAIIVVAIGISSIVIFISAISLLAKIVRYLYLRSKEKEFPKIKFLRPLLSIVISVWLVSFAQQFKQPAEEYLWQQASAIQKSCDENKVCPTALEGWENKQGLVRKTHLIKNVKFFVFYFVTDKTFEVHLSYGFDSGYFLKGGVGQQVQEFRPPY